MTILASNTSLFPANSGARQGFALEPLPVVDGLAPRRGCAASWVTVPPRLNFAGFCNMCGDRGCQQASCIDRYQHTWWMVCPACGGDSYGPDGLFCPNACLWGVVETHPFTEGAVRP